MHEENFLAGRFEASRGHLERVAYRMLGSRSEADDAVQEAWLKVSRSSADGVENLGGWLTTVVARVCLDMLRSRRSRREDPFGPHTPEPVARGTKGADPEEELALADSVGLALLVVLQTLEPAERVAFVLHDMFDLPFDEIAPILGRSSTAARQLASRARRRVQGKPAVPQADLGQQRRIVEAYLAASRGGDLQALLALLDPDVVIRVDAFAAPGGKPVEIRGATAVARQALAGGRGRQAQTALIDGAVGIVVAPGGRLGLVLTLVVADDLITEIDVITDPERLDRLDLAVLN